MTLTTAGTGGKPMQVWAEFLGEPRLLDPKFATRASRNDNWEELRDLVAPKLMQWTNLDLMRETMARGLVIGLVQSPEQVVNSPHLAERGYFVELDHPEAGTLKYPGPGFLLRWRQPDADDARGAAAGRAQRRGLLRPARPFRTRSWSRLRAAAVV